MNYSAPLYALAFTTSLAQAADPAPALALPWPLVPVASQSAGPVPETPEGWMTRMTDFTRNASAYKDPRVFVPWTQAMTEPSFYLTAAKGAMEPGGWLNMMNSMAHPDAVRNYMGLVDPNVVLRWGQAGVDPAFYAALLTQFSDPGKLARWAMMPADPRMWDIMLATVNPNTYIRWGMAAMDPRTWNLMGTVMNPALYTSMAGMLVNPNASGPEVNPWLSWRPVNVMGASSPWGQDPVASFNMFDPALLSNMATFLPSLPNLTGLTGFNPVQPSADAAAASSAAASAEAANVAAANAAANQPVQVVPVEPAQPITKPVAAADNRIVLAGDTLFKTGKSGIKDLSKEGKRRLDEVAGRIKTLGPIESIKIVGHADITGKPAANQRLSERRARAVKSYLVAKGVKPALIHTSGVGDTQPVAECDMTLPKKALLECLAPNRRVELEVSAKNR